MVQTCLLLVKLPLAYTLFYIIDLVSLKKWKIKTAFIYSFILFATAILFYVFVEENIIQKYLLVPNIPMPVSYTHLDVYKRQVL